MVGGAGVVARDTAAEGVVNVAHFGGRQIFEAFLFGCVFGDGSDTSEGVPCEAGTTVVRNFAVAGVFVDAGLRSFIRNVAQQSCANNLQEVKTM